MKTFLRYWLPVLLWMVVIFWISADSNPYRTLPKGWKEVRPPALTTPTVQASISLSEFIGRNAHLGEYMLLGALTLRAFRFGFPRQTRISHFVLAIMLSTAYAFSDEIHQEFIPGRSFQWSDLVLDTCGSVIGALVFLLLFQNSKFPLSQAFEKVKGLVGCYWH